MRGRTRRVGEPVDPVDQAGVLSLVVKAQAETIQSQGETIKQQNLTIQVLSGARGKAVNLDLTVSELWDRYVRTFPDGEAWPRSVQSMMRKVLAHFGPMKVADLQPYHWTDFRDSEPIKHGLSVTTRNLQYRRTRAMMAWAVADGRILADPFEHVKAEPPRPKRETEFSEIDEERIVEHAPEKLRVLFVVAMASGMRHTEIRLLRWDQIDFKARTISLSWAENKGKRSATAYLTNEAVKALRSMPRVDGSPYVFTNPKTKEPFTYACFYRMFRKVTEGLAIKCAPGDGRVHAHDTRHTVASRLSRRGAPLPSIQRILRHKNLATTERYIHTTPNDIAAAHALLEQCRSSPRHGPKRAPPTVKEKAEARTQERLLTSSRTSGTS